MKIYGLILKSFQELPTFQYTILYVSHILAYHTWINEYGSPRMFFIIGNILALPSMVQSPLLLQIGFGLDI